MTSQTDRIEKHVELAAPVARVWSALTDSKQFGTWFQCVIDEPFVAGTMVHLKLTNPEFDTIELDIERVELANDGKSGVFALRWHPFPIGRRGDYAGEPKTRVEFRVSEIATGTKLVITESGFDAIPAARRARAFEMNSGGWTEQIRRVTKYLEAR